MSSGILAKRARLVEQLATRVQREADKAHGARAAALREESRDLRAEALRFTLATRGRRR